MFIVLKKCLIGASLVALAFSFNVECANATTCKQLPSCSDLGYTTLRTSCSITNAVHCPFDVNYVFCPDCTAYPLTRSQCNSTYGTCAACPYNNSLYKYSSCTGNATVDSNGLCSCNRTTYLYQKIDGEPIGGTSCSDKDGEYTTATKCWSNARVWNGTKCVRKTMSVGKPFTWGGKTIGVVLKDDGLNITILGLYLLRADGSDGVAPDTFTTYQTLESAVNRYAGGMVCNSIGEVAPSSYRTDQYDPLCRAGHWRLPTTEEAGSVFHNRSSNGIINRMSGMDLDQWLNAGNCNKHGVPVPSTTPVKLNASNEYIVYEPGDLCYYQPTYLKAAFGQPLVEQSICQANNLPYSSIVSVEQSALSNLGMFPVRVVADITIN